MCCSPQDARIQLLASLASTLPELEAIPDNGPEGKLREAERLLEAFEQTFGARRRVGDFVEELVSQGRLSEGDGRAALAAYHAGSVRGIAPFEDVVPTLAELRRRGYRLGLLTTGDVRRQQAKLAALGLRGAFDAVHMEASRRGSMPARAVRAIARKLGCAVPQADDDSDGSDDDGEGWIDVGDDADGGAAGAGRGALRTQRRRKRRRRQTPLVMVGDQVFSEIRVAKRLGFVTVRNLHGRYSHISPTSDAERPDFTIVHLSSLLGVMEVAEQERRQTAEPVVTTIGGGTGMGLVLRGLRSFTSKLAAVVTVFDSGRHSGTLRSELMMLPPGDVRNCLVALSPDGELLSQLMNYRFSGGSLDGVSCGNLLLAALNKLTGSFDNAVAALGALLHIDGAVIPVTDADTHLVAKLKGTAEEVVSEVAVRAPGKPPIEQLRLQSSAKASPAAVRAVLDADVVIMGPGSLYTSVIACLLPDGMAAAVAQTTALRVYVANVATQAGQTDGMTLRDQVSALLTYLGDDHALDVVVANSFVPPEASLAPFREAGQELLVPTAGDAEWFAAHSIRLVTARLVEDPDGRASSAAEFAKAKMLRHDAAQLSAVVQSVVEHHRAAAVRSAAGLRIVPRTFERAAEAVVHARQRAASAVSTSSAPDGGPPHAGGQSHAEPGAAEVFFGGDEAAKDAAGGHSGVWMALAGAAIGAGIVGLALFANRQRYR